MTMAGQEREPVPHPALTRRAIVLTAAIASVFGWMRLNPFSRYDGFSRAEAAILSVLRHRDSAAHIGNVALVSRPELAERPFLLSAIGDDLRMGLAELVDADAGEIRQRLSERIRMDFATGRTLKIDGWLLSLAEARLYALAALNRN